MGDSRASSPIALISGDEEEPVSPPVAAEYEWPPTADWILDTQIPRPDWLPDGFGMECYKEDDGTFQPTNFFCPVTDICFCTKDEVLEYCSSGALQRAMDAKNTLDDKTTLQGKYAWLRGDHKWLLEIRFRREDGRIKIFKVYAHPSSKVRITSKAEVMRLIDEGKLPDESANDGACNSTSNKDNIVAQLDFNVSSLPPGWVKETAFRKCSDGGIRTDRYYTDPLTKMVFRSLNAAEQHFRYEKDMDCYKPSMSVTDLYSFDGCMDMPLYLSRRLKMDGTKDQCDEEDQTSRQTLTKEVGEDGREVLHGDGMEDDEEQLRTRPLTELYLITEKGNLKRKGKKKNRLM